jgi:uncharacterized membrane protein
MKSRIKNTLGFLRTTLIGGVLFLLPLIVISALLGYASTLVIAIYKPLKVWIPIGAPTGYYAIVFLISVAIVVLLCFLAGIIARRAIARKLATFVERRLTMVFPKYAVYRDIIAGNVGGDDNTPSLKPIVVRMLDTYRVAFEAERLHNDLVVVYFPGSPDTWNGCVELVSSDQVQSLNVPFADALGIFERMGRDSAELLNQATIQQLEKEQENKH